MGADTVLSLGHTACLPCKEPASPRSYTGQEFRLRPQITYDETANGKKAEPIGSAFLLEKSQ